MNTQLSALPPKVLPLPEYANEKIRRELVANLEQGFQQAGIKTRRRRPGVLLTIEDGKFLVCLNHYLDHRWWRITYGGPDPVWPIAILGARELTFCRDEIVPDICPHLLALLRGENCHPWPIFYGDPTYPSYAWSARARESFQENRRIEKLRVQLLRERQAARNGELK